MRLEADSTHTAKAESTFTLETGIAIGLVGWLALSMTLMGLGIW